MVKIRFAGHEKTKPNKANLLVLSAAGCVLRKEFEKTKPISGLWLGIYGRVVLLGFEKGDKPRRPTEKLAF